MADRPSSASTPEGQGVCPTCGSPVRVVSADEGTQHFEPATDRKWMADVHVALQRYLAALERIAAGDFPMATVADDMQRVAKEALVTPTTPDREERSNSHDHGAYRDGPCYGCECGEAMPGFPLVTCDLKPGHDGNHRATWRNYGEPR